MEIHCIVIFNSKEVRDYSIRFHRGHGSFFDPGNEEKWCGTYSHKPEKYGTMKTIRWSNTQERKWSSHIPRYKCAQLRNPEEKGRNTIHFTTESVNLDFLLRTNHLANQLCSYRAVSSRRDALAEQMLVQTSLGVDKSTSKVNDQLSKQVDPQEVCSLVQSQTEDRKLRETAGVIIYSDSRCWIQMNNSYNL